MSVTNPFGYTGDDPTDLSGSGGTSADAFGYTPDDNSSDNSTDTAAFADAGGTSMDATPPASSDPTDLSGTQKKTVTDLSQSSQPSFADSGGTAPTPTYDPTDLTPSSTAPTDNSTDTTAFADSGGTSTAAAPDPTDLSKSDYTPGVDIPSDSLDSTGQAASDYYTTKSAADKIDQPGFKTEGDSLNGENTDLNNRWQSYVDAVNSGQQERDPQFEASIQGEGADLQQRAGDYQNRAGQYQSTLDSANAAADAYQGKLAVQSDDASNLNQAAGTAAADQTQNYFNSPSFDQSNLNQAAGEGGLYTENPLPDPNDPAAVDAQFRQQYPNSGPTAALYDSSGNPNDLAGEYLNRVSAQMGQARADWTAANPEQVPALPPLEMKILQSPLSPYHTDEIGGVQVPTGMLNILGLSLGAEGLLTGGVKVAVGKAVQDYLVEGKNNMLGQFVGTVTGVNPFNAIPDNTLLAHPGGAVVDAVQRIKADPTGFATAVKNNVMDLATNWSAWPQAAGSVGDAIQRALTQDPVTAARQAGYQGLVANVDPLVGNSGRLQAAAVLTSMLVGDLQQPTTGIANVDPLRTFDRYQTAAQTAMSAGVPADKAYQDAFNKTAQGWAELVWNFNPNNPAFQALETPFLADIIGQKLQIGVRGQRAYDEYLASNGLINGQLNRLGPVPQLMGALSKESGVKFTSDALARGIQTAIPKMSEDPTAVQDAFRQITDMLAVRAQRGLVPDSAYQHFLDTYGSLIPGIPTVRGMRTIVATIGDGLYANALKTGIAPDALAQALANRVEGYFNPGSLSGTLAEQIRKGLVETSNDLLRTPFTAEVPRFAALRELTGLLNTGLRAQYGLPAYDNPNLAMKAIGNFMSGLRSAMITPAAFSLSLRKLTDEGARNAAQGIYGLNAADFGITRFLGAPGAELRKTGAIGQAITQNVPVPRRIEALAGTRNPFQRITNTLVGETTRHAVSSAFSAGVNRFLDTALPAHQADLIAALTRAGASPEEIARATEIAAPGKSAAGYMQRAGELQPAVPSFAGQSRMTAVRNDINRTPQGLVGAAGTPLAPGFARDAATTAGFTGEKMPLPNEIAPAKYGKNLGSAGGGMGQPIRDIAAGEGGALPVPPVRESLPVARPAPLSDTRNGIGVDLAGPGPFADAIRYARDNPAATPYEIVGRYNTSYRDAEAILRDGRTARGPAPGAERLTQLNQELHMQPINRGTYQVRLSAVEEGGTIRIRLERSPTGANTWRPDRQLIRETGSASFDTLGEAQRYLEEHYPGDSDVAPPGTGGRGDIAAGDGGAGYLSTQQRNIRDDLNAMGGFGTGTTRDVRQGPRGTADTARYARASAAADQIEQRLANGESITDIIRSANNDPDALRALREGAHYSSGRAAADLREGTLRGSETPAHVQGHIDNMADLTARAVPGAEPIAPFNAGEAIKAKLDALGIAPSGGLPGPRQIGSDARFTPTQPEAPISDPTGRPLGSIAASGAGFHPVQRGSFTPTAPPSAAAGSALADVYRQFGHQRQSLNFGASQAGIQLVNRAIGELGAHSPIGEKIAQWVYPFSDFHFNSTAINALNMAGHPILPVIAANYLAQNQDPITGNLPVFGSFLSNLDRYYTGASMLSWANDYGRYIGGVGASGNNPFQKALKIGVQPFAGNNPLVAAPFDVLNRPLEVGIAKATNPVLDAKGRPIYRDQVLANEAFGGLSGLARMGADQLPANVPFRAQQFLRDKVAPFLGNPAGSVLAPLTDATTWGVNQLPGKQVDLKSKNTLAELPFRATDLATQLGWRDPARTQNAVTDISRTQGKPLTQDGVQLLRQLQYEQDQGMASGGLPSKFSNANAPPEGAPVFPPFDKNAPVSHNPGGSPGMPNFYTNKQEWQGSPFAGIAQSKEALAMLKSDNPAVAQAADAYLNANQDKAFQYARNAGTGGRDLGQGVPAGTYTDKAGNPNGYYIESPAQAQYATARADIAKATAVTPESVPFMDYNRQFLGNPDIAAMGSAKEQASLPGSIAGNASRTGAGLPQDARLAQIAKEEVLQQPIGTNPDGSPFTLGDLMKQPGNVNSIEAQLKGMPAGPQKTALEAALADAKARDSAQTPAAAAYFAQQDAAFKAGQVNKVTGNAKTDSLNKGIDGSFTVGDFLGQPGNVFDLERQIKGLASGPAKTALEKKLDAVLMSDLRTHPQVADYFTTTGQLDVAQNGYHPAGSSTSARTSSRTTTTSKKPFVPYTAAQKAAYGRSLGSSGGSSSATAQAIAGRSAFDAVFTGLTKAEQAAAYKEPTLAAVLAKGARPSAAEWATATETLKRLTAKGGSTSSTGAATAAYALPGAARYEPTFFSLTQADIDAYRRGILTPHAAGLVGDAINTPASLSPSVRGLPSGGSTVPFTPAKSAKPGKGPGGSYTAQQQANYAAIKAGLPSGGTKKVA